MPTSIERVAIIIPAFNEAENLKRLLPELLKVGIARRQVLVVDDCSSDATSSTAQAYGVNVLRLVVNLGIGGAVQSGFKWALRNGFDFALQVDGDGQHDPSFIPALLQAAHNSGVDAVIGSRFVGSSKEGFQSTTSRRLGIKWLSFLLLMFTGQRVHDVTSGMRLLGRKWLEEFTGHYPVDYPEPETLALIAAAGGRLIEVPVVMRNRSAGESSINHRRAVYYMIRVSIGIVLAALRGRLTKGGTR